MWKEKKISTGNNRLHSKSFSGYKRVWNEHLCAQIYWRLQWEPLLQWPPHKHKAMMKGIITLSLGLWDGEASTQAHKSVSSLGHSEARELFTNIPKPQ